MKELNLTVDKRDATGTGPNRRLRSQGIIPAVVYGADIDPIPISVDYNTLFHAMQGRSLSTIINLDINGNEQKVLITDLQKDPVTGNLMHIDFYKIAMNKPIELTIPIKVTGTAIGVTNYGGILQMIRREIEIRVLPADIPDNFEVDVTDLNVGESIHVGDIKTEGFEIITDPNRTIITVVPPTVMKTTTTTEEEGAEAEGEEAAEAKAGEDDEEKKEKE